MRLETSRQDTTIKLVVLSLENQRFYLFNVISFYILISYIQCDIYYNFLILYKNIQICQLEDLNQVIQNLKKKEELNLGESFLNEEDNNINIGEDNNINIDEDNNKVVNEDNNFDFKTHNNNFDYKTQDNNFDSKTQDNQNKIARQNDFNIKNIYDPSQWEDINRKLRDLLV